MPRSRWLYSMPSTPPIACSVPRLYSDMRTSARIFGAILPGRHSRRNCNPHHHCLRSKLGRKTMGESSLNSQRASLRGACGLAHGSEYDTEIWQPLARLVSWAGPLSRSMTTTSWPACFSHHAVDVPITPLPSTAILIVLSFNADWTAYREESASHRPPYRLP